MVVEETAPTVSVTERMKIAAEAFASKVVNETYNRFTYDLDSRKQKIYFGKLGEEVFAGYLSNFGIVTEIDYNIYPGTTSIDETDLVVSGLKIDIKVGTQKFHKRLLIVKQYFDNGHQSDFYVAINFYGDVAKIYGYATRDDIQSAMVHKWDKINPIDDYTILYRDLKPIEKLVELIKSK